MEFWVDDLKWGTSRRRLGRDDSDFYWEKYGEYFSPDVPVDWNSRPLKALSAYKHRNSYFTIKKILDAYKWKYMMQILARIDVSQIKRMELDFPLGPDGIDHLIPVLASGRLSGLKALIIASTEYPVNSGRLKKALKASRLPNLVTLSLPLCDVNVIAGALKAKKFSQIRSFSIGGTPGIAIVSPLGENQKLGAVVSSFTHLQHLNLSDGLISSVYCWKRFIQEINSGKVPHLTSLCLSRNRGVLIADLVPFLLSNQVENLIMSGLEINSVDIERFADAIMNVAVSSLALKRLHLRENQLDDTAVASLVLLASSDKLAHLQELDLRINPGLDSRALIQLMETIQRGHLPSLCLLMWRSEALGEGAFARLCNEIDGLADECYHVLHRFSEVIDDIGLSSYSGPKSHVYQYSVKKIELSDIKERIVDWQRELNDIKEREVDWAPSASVRSFTSGTEDFGTILERNELSAVDYLELRITSENSDNPAVLGQGQEASAQFAKALTMGQFTSLLTPSIPARYGSVVALSLRASYASAILRALNENHISHLSAFSIFTVESLDSCSQTILYRDLEAALTGGCFKGLQHLELSNGVLDGVDVWGVLTRAITSGNLKNITSVCLGKNVVADVGPLLMFNVRRRCMIMNGRWINSEQVWGLADAIINATETGFSLEELELCNGVLDGMEGWKVFTSAMKSGKLANMRSLRLSQNALNRINLEDLIPLILSKSFVNLTMDGCWINSKQVWGLADALMNGPKTGLALKRLDLRDNLLGNSGVDALVSLAHSSMLPQLEILNLGMNRGLDVVAFKSLMSIQNGRLCSLETLSCAGVPVNDVAVGAIVEAYHENEDLTMSFDFDWNHVTDPALETKVNGYRARNIRLCTLKEKHREVLDDVVPLTCAKIFLCGFPEVGKTTLRRALTHSTVRSHSFKEAPTRGIELSQLEERNMTLTLWDLAGQEEYHVLHGTFFVDLGLAGGKATVFVLVLRANISKSVADLKKDLLYWFKFMASSSQRHVKRHVVIVLNCFDGQPCTKAHMALWMASIETAVELFRDLLHIHLVPFALDVRSPELVQPLKDWLFDQAHILLQNVRVPRVCFELQEELARWSQGDKNGHLPIMTWESFEKQVNLMYKENKLTGKNLEAATLYLHEIGGIIYFVQKQVAALGSKDRAIVVLYPEWFCRQVVGELLLPEDLLEEGCSLIRHESGLIPIYWFECYFKHLLVEGTQSDDIVSMLERVGLCYRKDANEIMVPALIQEDDVCLTHWEDEGCHFVIGRSLSTEDYERTAIPITLFRRLQVELAQDANFGGRGDSEYRAGKYSSSFKVGELSFLIQVEANSSNPNEDRIDILAKTVDPTKGTLSQVERVCEIMQKLQVLCFACCPGLRYDIKVIKPWSATKETPKMTERQLMSLREIKVLLLQGQQYSSWRNGNGNAVGLQTFLSNAEMKALREINSGINTGVDEGTDEAGFPQGAVEEMEGIDYYYDSDFSEGSEDPNVSLDEVEESDVPVVSSQRVEEIEEVVVELEPVDEAKDDLGELLAEESLQIVKEPEEENSCTALRLGKDRAFVHHHNMDHQGITIEFVRAQFQEVKDMISDARSHLDKAVHGEGDVTRQHVDEGKKEVLLKIQAHSSFSIAEKEKSVPMFLFLKRKDSSRFWTSFKDRLKAPFQKDYRLHFLCESQFGDGKLHWVRDQEGLKLSKRTDMNEWLKKVEPWVRWSYYVIADLAKIALTVFVPGTAGAIPSISTSTEEHNKARDTAVKMLQNEDETIYHRNPGPAEQLTDGTERLIAEGQGRDGTSDHLTDVNVKLIAKAVVFDLIRDLGMGTFLKGTRLRRVLLKARPQHDGHRYHAIDIARSISNYATNVLLATASWCNCWIGPLHDSFKQGDCLSFVLFLLDSGLFKRAFDYNSIEQQDLERCSGAVIRIAPLFSSCVAPLKLYGLKVTAEQMVFDTLLKFTHYR
ncbi:unnamed protein product [Calypogeia fissa]